MQDAGLIVLAIETIFISRSYIHHRSYYRNYYYDSDGDWTRMGIGLLTGVAVGSILYQPPRQQTIVYNNFPPDWLYIRTAKGQYGWIMTQYTQAVPRPVG